MRGDGVCIYGYMVERSSSAKHVAYKSLYLLCANGHPLSNQIQTFMSHVVLLTCHQNPHAAI
jgi:hypothetical protein